jgi:hypothetical protein
VRQFGLTRQIPSKSYALLPNNCFPRFRGRQSAPVEAGDSFLPLCGSSCAPGAVFRFPWRCLSPAPLGTALNSRSHPPDLFPDGPSP